ncbi:hypothetical protein, partial [Micromonospora sp. WMMD736]|uniref:hypothetical protein n=1 Tax=Micromonospora sp. WMMD736 TaxID=3404112 RepID=UPI003B934A5F
SIAPFPESFRDAKPLVGLKLQKQARSRVFASTVAVSMTTRVSEIVMLAVDEGGKPNLPARLRRGHAASIRSSLPVRDPSVPYIVRSSVTTDRPLPS